MTTRTDKDMEASGQWAKFGKAAWKHATGVMVSYDCNAWGWRVDTLPGKVFSRLWVARFEAERGPR
jgi:hypothetical protein